MSDKWELAEQANKRAAAFKGYLDVVRWFDLAWAREIPILMQMPRTRLGKPGAQLNLGAGFRQIGTSEPLDLEHGWNAETDRIPYGTESISGIWAHGFFEHLTGPAVIRTLRECERVLVPRGVLNVVVPHGMCENNFEEIEHYTAFTEHSFANLLANPYYKHEGGDWKLRVYTSFIMGVVWRNMAVFTQMVKS